ncbi:MAG TPA: hypothetical protein PLE45_04285 [Spirochaetota bacterium]|mgnify:CR=1 FL=1|nr:hypothetical protein [Spirochaetota bacterium]HOL57238.1 hypothetical protein [Spirochaetota bacterium]HPP03325.1 hypothetical protein [Spirochaetota bacterium]
MLKKICSIFLIIGGINFIYAQYEPIANLQTQRILYNQAKNIREKSERIKDIYKVATEEYKSFITDILVDVANYFLQNDMLEKRTFDEWAYYSILTASKLKMKEAAPYFRDIFQKVSRSDYRGHILFLIGESQNRELLPFLNEQLKYYNNKQRLGDVKVKDIFIMIEGCLTGLEFFLDPTSFLEVFYAVNAYNERIRDIATRVRDKIAEKNDAATICDDIIKTNEDLELVYDILNYSFKSKSPDEKKIKNCHTALNRMLNDLSAKDLVKKDIILRIKNLAVTILGELKAGDPTSLELIKLKWSYDKDEKSDQATIEALRKIGNEEVVRILTNRLALYIKILKEGGKITFEKEYAVDFIRVIVRALGDMNSKIPLPELETIKTGAEFGKPLQDEAEKAIAKILKK